MTSDDPKSVGEALDQLLGTLNTPPSDVVATVFGRWDEIVGAAAAQHCRPVAIEGDQLIVVASEAVWASELRWLATNVVDRINQMSGNDRLRSLSVRVAPPRS